MSAEDRNWQARSDANTIAEAAGIKADQVRYSAAQKAAQEIAAEEAEKNKAMQKLAKGDWPLKYETAKM